MTYLTCVTYGQSLSQAKLIAEGNSYTTLARRMARGLYDVYTLAATPMYNGQAEFIVRADDRVLN